MKRHRVLNDQIQRVIKRVHIALDGMDKPENSYKACVEIATDGMQELAELQRTFQTHLDAGTLLEEIEVYTETIWHLPTHDLIQYWRLLPGSDRPEHLFPGCKGAFDFKDAARDRAYDWPGASYISPSLFLDAVSEQDKGLFAGYDTTEY